MELILRDMGMNSLKEHLNQSRDYCESLASRFQQAPTSLEQTNLAFRWDAALKHSYMVEFLLELLKRRERDGEESAGSQHIRLKAHRHRSSAADRHFTQESAVAIAAFTPRISSTSGSAR